MLNKTDLVDEHELCDIRARLREINALADIIPAEHARVDLARVLDVGAFDLSRVLETDPQFLTESDHQHDASVASVGIDTTGEVDVTRLNAWLGELLSTKGVDIFRSKGILALAGDERQYVFQGVHMLFDGAEGRPWRAGEPRTNRLVFIGRDLDRADLTAGFTACLIGADA